MQLSLFPDRSQDDNLIRLMLQPATKAKAKAIYKPDKRSTEYGWKG